MAQRMSIPGKHALGRLSDKAPGFDFVRNQTLRHEACFS